MRVIGKALLNTLLFIGAAAVIIFAFLPESTFQYPYIFSLVMNAMHFPAGFFVVLLGYALIPFARKYHWLLLVFGTVFFAAIEYLQPLIGRTSSMHDLIISDLGVLFGWLFAVSKKPFGRGARYLSLCVALGIFSYLMKPGAMAIYHAYQAHQVFPVFVDMETSLYSLVLVDADSRIVKQDHEKNYMGNHHYLRFTKPNTPWPGINLRIIQPNWQGYNYLCFDAKGSEPDSLLFVRFDDEDSINGSNSSTHTLAITDQWSDYCMDYPQLFKNDGRHIDTRRMKEVIFFLDHKRQETYFDMDNITLN